MSGQSLDVVFDMHGVLADVQMVTKNYENYLASILLDVNPELSFQDIVKIHADAFNIWFNEIMKISYVPEGKFNSKQFMDQYKAIDLSWEKYIMQFVPEEKRGLIEPLLKTSVVEYQALAKGKYSSIFPEVYDILETLSANPAFTLHIASSASSFHVRGFVQQHNLSNFFSHLIGYDTVEASKKRAGDTYFRNMIQIIGCNPVFTVFIGDTEEEAMWSQRTGFKFIMVDRNKRKTAPLQAETKVPIINDLTGLPSLLEQIILQNYS